MLIPRNNQIICKRIEHKEISRGGLILLDSGREKDMGRAVVVSVGPQAYDISVGATIILPNHYGHEIEHNGEKLTIINEDKIVGEIEEDDK